MRPKPPTPNRSTISPTTALLAAACLSLAAGCGAGADARPQVELREPPKTAAEVLDRAVEAYHQANSYQDDGQLIVEYTCDGKTTRETSEFSLALSGPNHLRIRAHDALAVCDGKTFRAAIDAAPDEMLSLPAPEEIWPGFIYSDLALGGALNRIVGSVPLALYLDPKPLRALLANAQAPVLDSPAKIGDHDCHRVRIERREGSFVLWIDQRSFVARRVEYPADGYRRLLEPYTGPISDMKLTAELVDAELDAAVDDALFHLPIPRGAEVVAEFDIVRHGARVPKFKLRALDGRGLSRESLADKIVVLKFFQFDDLFNHHQDMAAFDRVAGRYADNDAIAFLAVSADPDEVTDEELKAAFAEARLKTPLARVSPRVAFWSFALQRAPATIVLGRGGKLQEHVVGVYPDQSTALPKQLDTLLAGGDLTLEVPRILPQYFFYSGFAWQYAHEPEAEAAVVAPSTALAKAEIAAAEEPARLRRTRLWSNREVKRPGDLLVAPRDGEDRVFVVEGLPRVAELDQDGRRVAAHWLELDDRDDADVSFIRTAAGADRQRYFVGSKPGTQQVYLFDADWKRRLSFPDDGDHSGISDATLADLDGDGQLEMYVGYMHSVGVHAVALDGQRLWRNRTAENVFNLAASGQDSLGQRQLLVAAGALLAIDAAGRDRPSVVLSDAFVRLVRAADLDGDGLDERCAIVQQWQGEDKPVRNVAVGLSPQGRVLWTYLLRDGMHADPAAETVAAGKLLPGAAGQWVIAAADGSIHILSADGQPIDHFATGASTTGLAIANLQGRGALVVSTRDAVEAWTFDEPTDATAAP